jgi:uncharacterized membrane-anchored protein
MNRIISLIILAIGVVLMVYGIRTINAEGGGFSHLFSVSPMDKSLWLLISGAIAAAIGTAGLVRRSKSNTYHSPSKP